MNNFRFAPLLCLLIASTVGSAQDSITITKRTFDASSGEKFETETWNTNSLAVIVCDMWDLHHCFNAVGRVNELSPRMDKMLRKLRDNGATIIHSPSSCVGFYKEHPARKNVALIPKSTSIPDGIGNWCDNIPSEKNYPLDQSDGGEDDDLSEHQAWAKKLASMGRNPRAPWKRQVESVYIADNDFISDRGEEVWSILDHKKIDNVMLVGVHTNMCVLGRPFGLRQLSKNGKNVVLVRDLTDTMYNPGRWPFVDHFQGNRLIHRHIEKYVCPTITSDQILRGTPLRFKNDKPKKCLIIAAESLYKTDETLPIFAKTVLWERLGIESKVLSAVAGQHAIERLEEEISSADLLLLSVRRRSLPQSQLAAIKKHLSDGKPLIAIRTSSHAFDTKGKHPDGHAEWEAFDKEVLGCNYIGHYANDLECSLTPTSDHPILTNVNLKVSMGSLYRSKPLAESANQILTGKVEGHAPEPVAWTNQFGNSNVFYTSLGHPSDFKKPNFNLLLENAVRWTMKMKIGAEPSRKK